MNESKLLKNQKGQSSVEFAISFIMVIGFVFMYVKVALNFTNGYVVHYANFMASRAFMVYEGNNNTPLFDGTSNVSLTLGNKLPPGIYFYVFNPRDNSTIPFQGNFYLGR